MDHKYSQLRTARIRQCRKSRDDPGILQETISRIRVAGIQVYKRPTLLIDAIRKASLQVLYIPDRRRILLDASLPKLEHRWSEGH